MRNSFFLLIAMILVTGSASAQWRPNPFFFNFKGLKADSVLIVPRDTIHSNAGAEPDSGRLAYKNGSLWLRNGAKWNQIPLGPAPLFRHMKIYTANGGQPGDPTQGNTELIDTTLNGWEFEIYRAAWGRFMNRGTEWEYKSGGGFSLLTPNDWFYAGSLGGEFVYLFFYPKGITIITN